MGMLTPCPGLHQTRRRGEECERSYNGYCIPDHLVHLAPALFNCTRTSLKIDF